MKQTIMSLIGLAMTFLLCGSDSSFTSGNNLTVARYVNGAWQYLGGQHFANGGVINVRAVSGVPFALFADNTQGGKATLMAYY